MLRTKTVGMILGIVTLFGFANHADAGPTEYYITGVNQANRSCKTAWELISLGNEAPVFSIDKKRPKPAPGGSAYDVLYSYFKIKIGEDTYSRADGDLLYGYYKYNADTGKRKLSHLILQVASRFHRTGIVENGRETFRADRGLVAQSIKITLNNRGQPTELAIQIQGDSFVPFARLSREKPEVAQPEDPRPIDPDAFQKHATPPEEDVFDREQM